jgi:hypothetical protein
MKWLILKWPQLINGVMANIMCEKILYRQRHLRWHGIKAWQRLAKAAWQLSAGSNLISMQINNGVFNRQ